MLSAFLMILPLNHIQDYYTILKLTKVYAKVIRWPFYMNLYINVMQNCEDKKSFCFRHQRWTNYHQLMNISSIQTPKYLMTFKCVLIIIGACCLVKRSNTGI